MTIALISNPAHDVEMSYLSAWTKKVVSENSRTDIQVTWLEKEDANSEKFTTHTGSIHTDLIVMNGHGNERAVAGHSNEILVEVGKNEDLLKNSIVHTLACESADELGPAAIYAGCVAYVGYTEKFEFYSDDVYLSPESNIISDCVASLFLDPAYTVLAELLKGSNSQDAHKAAQIKYRDNLNQVMSANDPDLNHIAASILKNFKSHICLGDSTATIYS